jgi:hypothetical protein
LICNYFCLLAASFTVFLFDILFALICQCIVDKLPQLSVPADRQSATCNFLKPPVGLCLTSSAFHMSGFSILSASIFHNVMFILNVDKLMTAHRSFARDPAHGSVWNLIPWLRSSFSLLLTSNMGWFYLNFKNIGQRTFFTKFHKTRSMAVSGMAE